ncbi:hypothetical protein O6H91_01G132700 [Diphasiastrum complanatum]|uniref:Uncharacterized protein n=1 Tax=Diphasiastrum complanatum TaxID=34168 RepID=A0ACC2EW49_DIPCM|nr:hypothetical protein O6H91_01G132700 [Diphasiastrum complanatum]
MEMVWRWEGGAMAKPLHSVRNCVCKLRDQAAGYQRWRWRGGCGEFSSRGERVHIPRTCHKAGSGCATVGLSAGRRLGGSTKRFSLVAGTWLHTTAQVEVNLPLPQLWDMWLDRDKFSTWMPWISSVEVFKDEPELSRWTLKSTAFGQNFEFSWIARNLQPIYHQKIHWRSVDGLPNRGAVRFYPRSPSSCGIQLTISYEVPEILAPFVSPLTLLVQNTLQKDLERFATLAYQNNLKV